MSYNNYYLACRFSVSAMALSIELEMAVAKELQSLATMFGVQTPWSGRLAIGAVWCSKTPKIATGVTNENHLDGPMPTSLRECPLPPVAGLSPKSLAD
jgi:hypothetical protein